MTTEQPQHLVIVILEQGRVVGTQIVPEDAQAHIGTMAVTARLCAGPGQTRHELRVAVPSNLEDSDERERFHASLAKMIGNDK